LKRADSKNCDFKTQFMETRFLKSQLIVKNTRLIEFTLNYIDFLEQPKLLNMV